MSKKYSKMKMIIWDSARGGIVASMILVGAGTAFAQTAPDHRPSETSRTISGMHTMHRFNSRAKVGAVVKSLGLSRAAIKQELKDGKTIKQILQEHGITMDELG